MYTVQLRSGPVGSAGLGILLNLVGQVISDRMKLGKYDATFLLNMLSANRVKLGWVLSKYIIIIIIIIIIRQTYNARNKIL